MTEREIVISQLAAGNRGVQAYFIKRVDLMLAGSQPPEHLVKFMREFWPDFKKGLAHGEKEQSR